MASALRRRVRADAGKEGLFLAGRNLTWWGAGLSIVATVFAADTPFWVVAVTYREGLGGHWFWWALAFGKLGAAFIFTPLWRRSRVTTDLELISVRYGRRRDGDALRAVRAAGELLQRAVGIGVNLIVAGELLAAMFDDGSGGATARFVAQGVVVVVALLVLSYTGASGLSGAVRSDPLQLAIAFGGSCAVALLAWRAVGWDLASVSLPPHHLDLWPSSGSTLTPERFALLLTIGWWSTLPDSGFSVQRTLATRNERDAVRAKLLSVVVLYVVRPLPWYLIGLISFGLFPDLDNADATFGVAMNALAGPGLRGLLIAGILAALMSTLDTYVNLGASYAVNDLWPMLRRKSLTKAQEVWLGRVTGWFLGLFGLFIATQAQSIDGTLKYLWSMYSGVALLWILRWCWWRISARCEWVALAASLITANLATMLLPESADRYAYVLAITFLVTTAAWLPMALLRAAPSEADIDFAQRLRLGGPGWQRVWRDQSARPEAFGLGTRLVAWLVSAVAVYSAMFVGLSLFSASYGRALALIAMTAVATWLLRTLLKRFLSAQADASMPTERS